LAGLYGRSKKTRSESEGKMIGNIRTLARTVPFFPFFPLFSFPLWLKLKLLIFDIFIEKPAVLS
jgi:hypothetical protein